MQNNEKMENLTAKKLDNIKNVNIVEYWYIWVIFEEKIAKTAIIAFLGKNLDFLKNMRKRGTKKPCQNGI